MKRLDGKVAIITGAGSGMGRAGATLFAREGARVVVAELSQPRGQQVADMICNEGGKAAFVQVDVGDSAAVQAMVQFAEKTFGGVDILYCNASDNHMVNTRDACCVDLDEEVFDAIHRVAMRGCFLCAKYAGRAMIRRGGGSIIFTSSVDGQVAVGGMDAYSAAKAGILGLTHSLAAGLGKHKIRVNAICPSFVDTESQAFFMKDPANVRVLESLHLLHPVPKAEGIVPLALFLASDEAGYLTGAVYQADGGYLAFKSGLDLGTVMKREGL